MSILRLSAVLRETGHKSHTTIYSAIRDGTFTSPVRLGPRSVGWPEQEVAALNAARVAGWPDHRIRELVRALHAGREHLVDRELGKLGFVRCNS